MSIGKKNYQFIQPIATNEEADIYLCEEMENGRSERVVVLKILQSNWMENQEAVRQYQSDIQLLQRLKHRHIAEIYDVIAIRGRTTIVMEKIEGIDLAKLISLMKNARQRVPLRVSLQIVSSVARALDEAYNLPPSSREWPLRVMHGNLKPANIMLQPNGVVRILDFGLVRADLGSRESSTRELQYEQREYMAPERLFFEPQGPASDIYSLSMTLFEMIAGKPLRRMKSSAQEHEQKIQSYCKKLLSPLKLSADCKEALYQLLVEGLAYESTKRPSAEDFSKRASMLFQALQGVDAVEWAERAVAHFCQSDASRLQGGLQGKVLGEDTQIYTKQNDDSTIRDEVDTSIMRRGAQMELSIDSISRDDVSLDSTLQDITLEEVSKSVNSVLDEVADSVADYEETFSEKKPVFDQSKTISSADRAQYRREAGRSQETNPDVTKQEVSQESGSFVPPMMINPQAMVVSEKQSRSEKNASKDVQQSNASRASKKGVALVSISLSALCLVLVGMGYLYVSQGDYSPKQTEVVALDKSSSEADVLAPKDEIVVLSKQSNAKKLEVRCGSERWKGDTRVVVPEGEWKNCMIVGRDSQRRKVFFELEELKKGRYVCFEENESCRWEE